MTLWAFTRTWEKDTFRRVAVAVSDCFSSDATHKLSVPGSVAAAVGGSASLVAISGGSHVLAGTYGNDSWSGYDWKLVEYPKSDSSQLRLLKRCLQKLSSSVFGSLDPFFDRSWCHALKMRRALQLDGVTFGSPSCHCHRGAVYAITSRGRKQHRGCVVSSWSTSRRLREGLIAAT